VYLCVSTKILLSLGWMVRLLMCGCMRRQIYTAAWKDN
jgi:hypothetical protein